LLTHIIRSILNYNIDHDTLYNAQLNFGGSDTHAMSPFPGYNRICGVALTLDFGSYAA